MYIHTIWFDKIHFVSRTELEGILRVGSGVGGVAGEHSLEYLWPVFLFAPR